MTKPALTIPINPDLASQAQTVLNDMGLDIVTVVNAFFERVVRREPRCLELLDSIKLQKKRRERMMLTLEKLRELIYPVASELELERVIVFGSYARGEQGEYSDVDLLIDSGGKLRGGHLFSAIYKIDKLIPRKTDIFEISEVKNPSQTYTAIINEGVTIYER